MAAVASNKPTALKTDAELEQSIAASEGRYKAIHKILNPFIVCGLLATALAMPLLLLPQAASIVVALAVAAGAAVGLGCAKGSAQYREKTQILEGAAEQSMRRTDPLRRAKVLGKTFREAMTGGVKEDLKVGKPLQLKKAPAP